MREKEAERGSVCVVFVHKSSILESVMITGEREVVKMYLKCPTCREGGN